MSKWEVVKLLRHASPRILEKHMSLNVIMIKFYKDNDRKNMWSRQDGPTSSLNAFTDVYIWKSKEIH